MQKHIAPAGDGIYSVQGLEEWVNFYTEICIFFYIINKK